MSRISSFLCETEKLSGKISLFEHPTTTENECTSDLQEDIALFGSNKKDCKKSDCNQACEIIVQTISSTATGSTVETIGNCASLRQLFEGFEGLYRMWLCDACFVCRAV